MLEIQSFNFSRLFKVGIIMDTELLIIFIMGLISTPPQKLYCPHT